LTIERGIDFSLPARRNTRVNRRRFLTVVSSAAAAAGLRADRAFAQTQPATTQASAVPADVQWYDVRDWGVEGRGFSDTAAYYDRLPMRAAGVVREAVWNLSRNTAGMSSRFETDSATIFVRYGLTGSMLAMAHMPATGVSGVDLYAKLDGVWRWCATHFPKSQTIEAQLVSGLPVGNRAYQLNLPLYNGVSSLEVGVLPGAMFTPTPPREAAPILFYGTSITQGGCASRPGLAFTNILGRRLDRPMLNFGFSGNGHTEVEVGQFLCELKPAIFVLDCMANTLSEVMHDRTVAVVKQFRAARTETPVLLLEDRTWASGSLAPGILKASARNRTELRRAFETLKVDGVANLHYRIGDDLIGSDGEGTVDGSHPNDLGMMRYADALEPELRKLLG
jgi:lysophospholipase L1-like esterase